MNKKLISIITPSFNSEEYLEETYHSIKSQTYTNWEWLITDDGSTDKTIELIQNLIDSDDRIKLFENSTNRGPAVARNKSISNAKGNYMTFIDSDDLWESHFLEESLSLCDSTNGFVFSSYSRVDELTLKPIYKDFIVPKKVSYTDILKTNSISCLTAFIDVDRLGKKMMPLVRYRQDMGLWLQYLKEVKYAYGNKEVLAKYRIRKVSLSRNKKKLIKPQWYFYRNVSKLNIFQSIYYMTIWTYRGILKYQ
ncbi:glycosyltransferase family 2 protein [Flavobacteriaceae bacterium]|nr:glycosyltransferase family 2 protein [Flavobacteriaceae bacterium]